MSFVTSNFNFIQIKIPRNYMPSSVGIFIPIQIPTDESTTKVTSTVTSKYNFKLYSKKNIHAISLNGFIHSFIHSERRT